MHARCVRRARRRRVAGDRGTYRRRRRQSHERPSGATPGGTGAGYAPVVATLAVGDAVRFRNSDGFAHTATSIAASAFPTTYPFTAAALQPTGDTLSGRFSSGSLAAGASSPSFVADRTGTYLYGCFYHYGSPMRAAIVVR